MGFTPCKAKQGWDSKKKKHKKIRAYRKYLWKEPTLNRCLLILDLKPFRFYISQRKAFYRQRIQEYSCIRKQTVDIDILVTSRSGHIKIKESLRISRRPSLKKFKWNQLSQFSRTSTKVIYTYKKDLGWPNFDNEPRVQDKQQVKEH